MNPHKRFGSLDYLPGAAGPPHPSDTATAPPEPRLPTLRPTRNSCAGVSFTLLYCRVQVSMNPHKRLGSLDSFLALLADLGEKEADALPPHIYSLARRAYTALARTGMAFRYAHIEIGHTHGHTGRSGRNGEGRTGRFGTNARRARPAKNSTAWRIYWASIGRVIAHSGVDPAPWGMGSEI